MRRFQIFLTDELREKLSIMSEEAEISMAEAIRRLIRRADKDGLDFATLPEEVAR